MSLTESGEQSGYRAVLLLITSDIQSGVGLRESDSNQLKPRLCCKQQLVLISVVIAPVSFDVSSKPSVYNLLFPSDFMIILFFIFNSLCYSIFIVAK